MKITKTLKYATFEWDDEYKTFTITEEDGNRVILNKVYSFAFMRFVIRMAQRNWYRKIKGENKNPKISEIEEISEREQNQLDFLINEDYIIINKESEYHD